MFHAEKHGKLSCGNFVPSCNQKGCSGLGLSFSFPELVHVYFQYNRKNGSYFKLADYCCSEDFFNVNEIFPPILSSSKT